MTQNVVALFEQAAILLRNFISFYHQAYRAAVWSSRQNFRYVFGSLSRPYRLIVTPQNCRRCLFHIESLILLLYGPEGSSS